MTGTAPPPVPARAGIGLRAAHHDEFLKRRPPVAWVEVHSENFFAAGGRQPAVLEAVRRDYPLSLHGVGLSLGSTDVLDPDHLENLARLVSRVQPALVSEHLSFSSAGGVFLNDLLPLPFTREAVTHLVSRIGQVQDRLGRSILVENVSSYLAFAEQEMSEWEFLAAVARKAGCGILLDVNNIYVNACNHGFDARAYLAAIPPVLVGEVHLAGHTVTSRTGVDGSQASVLIDTHSTPVCEAVWDLYQDALRWLGPKPALIEWDAELPDLDRLLAEAMTAETMLARCCEVPRARLG